MSSNVNEQLERLCRQIPQEKDSEKMMKLVHELNQLLDEQESAKATPPLQISVKQTGDHPAVGGAIHSGEPAPEQRKSA